MKPSTILFILAGICLAPGLVLCYIAVFGGSVTAHQAVAAVILLTAGLPLLVTGSCLLAAKDY